MSDGPRTATADDFDAISRLILRAFHDDPEDRAILDLLRPVFEPARSLVMWDGRDLVGHVGAYGRELTVPGATVPATFVTNVCVAGTHRRKGVASTLLKRQLAAVSEPIAVLSATEGRIYHRYGYGVASRRVYYKLDTREIEINALVDTTGEIRSGAPRDFSKDLTGIYDRVVGTRPGFASRSEAWWDFALFDVPSFRRGTGPLQAIVYFGPDGAEGYALLRVRKGWEIAGPKGEVIVRQVVASTAAAYAELWRYLLRVDLTRSMYVEYASVDEPLFDLVNEPRRLGAIMTDGLWLRLVDVPAALAARQYPTDADLVIEVTDTLLPHNNGRFHRDGSRTGRTADLTLDVASLAALYLGGGSVEALAMAGRVIENRPGAVAEAAAAFGWHRAPVCIEMF